MKLHYYPETDSLYIELKAGPGSETREVAPGVMAETIQAAVLLVTSIGALFTGIAAVMKVRYWGKAHLLRAERGDPESPNAPSLPRL